jgi:Flp pilus assembly protein TadD
LNRLVPLVAVLVLVLAAPAVLGQGRTAAGQKDKAQPAAPAVLDSLGLLERAVARDSSDFDQLYRLGVMLLDRDRVAEASRVFIKANGVRPTDLKTMVNLGAAYDAAGQAEFAQQWYDKALAVAPGDSVALCRKASSIYGQARYPEALDLLRRIVREKPASHCAYFTLGVAFADAGLYRDAIRMWRKVVELAPESPEAVSARESIDVLEKFLAGPQGH